MSDPTRLKALESLVTANLIEKARRGETLTATDYKAINRLALDAGLLPPPAALPWLHDQLASCAKALGITTRTLDQWKGKGAPLGDAPFDELGLRIWHIGFSATSHGKARTLAAPAGALALYLEAITAAIAVLTSESATAVRDPSRLVKVRQAERLGLQNARSKTTLLLAAQNAFANFCGTLEKNLGRQLTTGANLEAIWRVCQGATRLQAEGILNRLIAAHITTSIRQTLDLVCNTKEKT